MSKPILFISDLHLCPEQPEITAVFIRFMRELAPQAEALYILGDFFEFWIGDDDPEPHYEQIRAELRNLIAKGVPIYFMHGNRDFLVGKRFAKQTGVKILKQPCVIDLHGTPTLLLHGDSLCIFDERHMRGRKIAYNKLIRFGFARIPAKKRRQLVNRGRNKSSHRGKIVPEYIKDVAHQAVVDVMRKYKTQHLIHGHTHKPKIVEFEIDNQPAKRIVLGTWHHQGSVLVCNPGEEPQLTIFK